jgi:hypothetical protein
MHSSSKFSKPPSGPWLLTVTVLLALMATATLGLSLLLPWYNMSITSSGEPKDYSYHENRDYSIHGRELSIEEKYASHDKLVLIQSDPWKEDFKPGVSPSDRALPDLYHEIRSIVIVGLVGSILLVAGILFFPSGRKRYLLLLPCIVMIVAGVAAPLHHMSENPDAMYFDDLLRSYSANSPLDSYFGHFEFQGMAENWGPAAGWYLSFLGAAFAACAMVPLALSIRGGKSQTIGKRTLLIAGTAAVVFACICLAYPFIAFGHQAEGHDVDNYLSSEFGDPTIDPSLQLMREDDGDWILYARFGARMPANYTYLQVTAPAGGKPNIDAPLSDGTESNPDFQFVDIMRNWLLDPGEYIILKSTRNGQPNPNIQNGSFVWIMKGGWRLTSRQIRLADPEPFVNITWWDKGRGYIGVYATASYPASETRIEIIDPATNMTIVNNTLVERNPANFVYRDNDHDSNFNMGDSITVYSNTTGQISPDPHVKAGFKIRILWKDRSISDSLAITW